MPTKKKPTQRKPRPKDVPQFFRLSVEVADLEAAVKFYTKLLGVRGARTPARAATSNADL